VSAPAASPTRAHRARAVVGRVPIQAWTLTAAFALLYVIVAPLSTDLAAAGYRSDEFSRAGFTLWDNGWYGGHHVLAYSVLAPALSALLSPQLLAALAATAATALFAALIDGCFAARATRIASCWFALGAAAGLLSNRVPFELGVAVGLAALLAARVAQRRRALGVLALVLAFVCALTSPIAGAFLALAALAWALAGLRSTRERPTAGVPGAPWLALGIAAAALVPIALLAIAFPEGGSEPFVASAFYPVLAVVLLIAVAIPREQRLLRTGVLLYALALIGAYVLPSAVGGNADRLGALFAGPLLACALLRGTPANRPRKEPPASPSADRSRPRAWHSLALIALAPLLLYWQLRAPISDYASAASDPAAPSSYYTPLLAELRQLRIGYDAAPARIEVVPTRNHMEARWVAGRVAIARGWERQLDIARNGVFYEHGEQLDASRYGAWLSQNAISYVALPDAPLDYSARGEAHVIGIASSYLREVWRSTHWRLFAVRDAAPLAQAPSALTQLGSDSFTLRAPAAGAYLVRVRFTPYWSISSGRGCVQRTRGDWTELRTASAESVHVAIGFSLARVFGDGPRCR
jgi:MFS family permease